MAWTNEQKEAIYTEGTNIIVSAGAGSGTNGATGSPGTFYQIDL